MMPDEKDLSRNLSKQFSLAVIKYLIEIKKYTQKEISNFLEVSEARVSQIANTSKEEQTVYIFTLPNLMKLSLKTGISPGELFEKCSTEDMVPDNKKGWYRETKKYMGEKR
jgi:predicted XRE-type DNA-binding protein